MRSTGPVFVFSGPFFANDMPKTIGAGKVWVPTHLYKLVFDQASKRAWAYWIENTNEARAGEPISYEDLRQRVGIEFIPEGLPLGPADNPC
jgi:endonuclease G